MDVKDWWSTNLEAYYEVGRRHEREGRYCPPNKEHENMHPRAVSENEAYKNGFYSRAGV